MKIAHIAPTAILSEIFTQEDDYHIISVDRVLNDPGAAEYYRHKPFSFLILDASAEDDILARKRINQAIELIYPTEILLPKYSKLNRHDAYNVAQYQVKEFSHYRTPFMVIPTGETLEDYLNCTLKMLTLELMNTIGIPATLPFKNQISLQSLIEVFNAIIPEVNIHLLESNDLLTPLISPKIYESVRGISTSILVRYGLAGTRITEERNFHLETIKIYKEDYYKSFASPSQIQIIQENISYWREYCK